MRGDLGQKFVEHPLWPGWRDGMKEMAYGGRLINEHFHPVYGVEYTIPHARDVPDLTDPPTLRCLLEILREVPGWERAYMKIEFDDHIEDEDFGGQWFGVARDDECDEMRRTEPEALLAAWDAAWEEQQK